VKFSLGDEVFDSYGPKSNDDYLLFYGFVVKKNCDVNGFCRNTMSLLFTIGKQQSNDLLEKKIKLLTSLDIDCVDSSLPMDEQEYEYPLRQGIGPGIPGLLFFFRIKVATAEELDHFLSHLNDIPRCSDDSTGDVACESELISPLNEARCLKALADYCKTRMKQYVLQYEENRRILSIPEESAGLTANKKTAITFIHSEQAIYQFWIDTAEVVCPILQTKNPSLEMVHALHELSQSSTSSYHLSTFSSFLAEELTELFEARK